MLGTKLFGELRSAVTEPFGYHELLYQMIRRDLLLRYKQTVLGVGWAVFAPLVNTAVFSVVFMRIAPVSTGVPYPLFAYCGLLFWNFSAASFRFSVNSLTANAALVSKVYFPREVLPATAVFVSLVDLLVGAVVLVGMLVYYGITPSWALLALPLVLLVQILFTIAVALILAMANLFFRDVKYLLDVLLTVWMFSTAVVYPLDGVEGRLRVLLMFNPMTPIIDSARSILLEGVWPSPYFVLAAVVTVVVAAVAILMFHRSENLFAENI